MLTLTETLSTTGELTFLNYMWLIDFTALLMQYLVLWLFLILVSSFLVRCFCSLLSDDSIHYFSLDNDPQWKGADSIIFMKEAYKKMSERGYSVGNVDVTLILESPKVKDLKAQMKANIVELLHTTPDRVNIKARTHEKVDSVGESRAYETHVVVLLERREELQ